MLLAGSYAGVDDAIRGLGGGLDSRLVSKATNSLRLVGTISVIRWLVRKGGSSSRWFVNLLARKHKKVAAVTLANKMTRMIWSVATKQEDYRMP